MGRNLQLLMEDIPPVRRASQAVVWHMLEGDANNIPTWLVKGRTALIPKEGCQGRTEQY